MLGRNRKNRPSSLYKRMFMQLRFYLSILFSVKNNRRHTNEHELVWYRIIWTHAFRNHTSLTQLRKEYAYADPWAQLYLDRALELHRWSLSWEPGAYVRENTTTLCTRNTPPLYLEEDQMLRLAWCRTTDMLSTRYTIDLPGATRGRTNVVNRESVRKYVTGTWQTCERLDVHEIYHEMKGTHTKYNQKQIYLYPDCLNGCGFLKRIDGHGDRTGSDIGLNHNEGYQGEEA